MISTKVYRGVAFAAVVSFLIPPMLLITVLSFEAVLGRGNSNIFENPSYFLPPAALALALVTCFWVPHSNRLRIAITVVNGIALLFCAIAGLTLLLGVGHVHF